MNSRMIKRYSYRSISVLLSVLMIISLFAVCFSVTVSATSGLNNIIYYDDTNTNFRDNNDGPFIVVGHSDYFETHEMIRIDGTNIYYYQFSNWTNNNEVSFYFSNWDRGHTDSNSGDDWKRGGIYDSFPIGDDVYRTKIYGCGDSIMNYNLLVTGGTALDDETFNGAQGRRITAQQGLAGLIIFDNNPTKSGKTTNFTTPWEEVYIYIGSDSGNTERYLMNQASEDIWYVVLENKANANKCFLLTWAAVRQEVEL